jgi:hypothetical protein
MGTSPTKYRVNASPRISANQLAEYALAAPSRRRTILRNAKFAPTYLVIRYGEARKAICSYLSNDLRPTTFLADEETRLLGLSQTAPTPFQQNDAALSAEAVRYFRKMTNQKGIPQTATFSVATNLPNLALGDSGTEVSVSIDLVARNKSKGLLGGVLLQTSKAVSAKSWRDEHSKYVASLVWLLAQKHLKEMGKIDRKLCMCIDVFGGRITLAPSSYKSRLTNLEAACDEINALWDNITPPPDFEE